MKLNYNSKTTPLSGDPQANSGKSDQSLFGGDNPGVPVHQTVDISIGQPNMKSLTSDVLAPAGSQPDLSGLGKGKPKLESETSVLNY